MKANDKAAMLANLVAQGITDIKSIDTSGSISEESAAPAAPAVPTPVSLYNVFIYICIYIYVKWCNIE